MDSAQWKTLGKLAGSLVAAGVLAAGVLMPIVLGSGIVARNEASRFLNTACDLKESAPPQKTYLYARNGTTLVATLFSQDRQLVPLSKVPKYLQDALIATEDRRFYQHHGVDPRGLLRSIVSTSSGDTQGGSTLTMQYVKQIRYFQAGDDPKKQQAAIAQNLQRKIEDMKCALYFENTKHESKAEILDNYLNIAFFGEHAYGIQTAAQTYFGKNVNQLNLAESATLVGLLRAPSAYDPYYYPAAAKERRNEVLQNLVAVGKLSQKQADEQKATPISLAGQSPPTVEQGCANANSKIANAAFFCEYASQWLADNNGISKDQQNTGGYKIVTTLEPSIQDAEQKHINKVVPAKSKTTAVLPTIDPRTGDVLAMAASKTYGGDAGQTYQPIFTSETTSGASTFKLFPILAALQMGISPDQQIKTVGNSGVYKATGCATVGHTVNGDANVNYNATESLTTAAQKSDNSYFVALAEKAFGCDLQPIIDLMRSLGISGVDAKSDNPKDGGETWAKVITDNQRAQQLVLGSSVPVSALQLAAAYAAIANNGVYNAPSPILSITDANGNDIPVKRTHGTQIVAPHVAQEALNILTGDTEGDGTSADAFGKYWYGSNKSPVAGKTGTADLDSTTNKSYQGKNGTVWFVGMTPDIVAAAGLINFDTPSVPNSGIKNLDDSSYLKAGAAYGDSAASVWIQSLRGVLKGQTWSWPDPGTTPGVTVPDLAGDSVSDAKSTLAGLGLKLSVLGGEGSSLLCDSDAAYNTIGYAGPAITPAGSTVYACLSSQTPLYYVAPVRRTTPTHRSTTTPGTGRGNSAAPGGGHATGGAGSTHGPGH